jgi:diguanylate cyclase (GGDEF)-like protein/PAS domain S-box-containing protein
MDIVKILAVAISYVLIAHFTHLYSTENGIVGVIRPMTGLGLATVLLGGRNYLLAVILGSFLINLHTLNNPFAAFAIATGSTLEIGAISYILKCDSSFNFAFSKLHDFIFLLKMTFSGCIIAAVIGAMTLTAIDFPMSEEITKNLLHWWMGDVLGILLITPFILVVSAYGTNQNQVKHDPIKKIALILLAGFFGQIVFFDWFHESLGLISRGYWLFPLLILGGRQLGVRGVTFALLIIGTQALSGAIHHVGFFADDLEKTQLLNYWFYMISLSIVAMSAVTHLDEQNQKLSTIQEKLHCSLDELHYYKIALDEHALVAMTDIEGTITYVNQKLCDISGYSQEELLGKNHRIINSSIHAKEFFKELYKCITQGKIWNGEICNRTKNGNFYWVLTTIVPFLDRTEKPTQYISIRTDITERKKDEEIIRQLAFYDPLTKLANRRLLIDRLEHAILASEREKEYGALMFLDLDKFKPLNDKFGHDAGDALLVEVAKRLNNCVRKVDTVARFGGDEFVVLLNELGADDVNAKQIALSIAEKIRLTLAEPYQLNVGGKIIEHQCTSSIGVVDFIGAIKSQDDILKQADDAMYQAKNGGRNTINFFAT